MTLFGPVILLATAPVAIYHFDRLPRIEWLCSVAEVIFGLLLLSLVQRGFRIRWPLVPEERLGGKVFSWPNLIGFFLVNVVVIGPGVLLYLAWCGSLAVDHFSGSFLALHSDRLAVCAKQFLRSDGKTIHLIPMMHIGESRFYADIARSVPTNSAILLEGVTDRKNLLKRKISYKRVATSLGLSEQQNEFEPAQGRPRPADVDIDQFSERSIAFLNLVTRVHSDGLTVDVLRELFEKSEDPLLMKELWDDLLSLRNEHLLKEIQTELRHSDTIVVPWGAAHMPQLSQEIQKYGFKLTQAKEYDVLHYRTIWNRLRSRRK